ncbi:enoyl-ACP reductase FabV [Pelagibaculum spongiae]|uniref:Enoyl-[acyl-carrier-protein] reductase [NADH] n=1 Tax=Pelagibaculum spongiae TaxID=2080658 RepID=A0A2V1GRY0_9GAMM|nr:enoyl-ACP reductase FabV [Pelagibaculum spongiae]PVZ63557.1 bifunctional NADH-specific enoyl-ACP reductase/trans-2-enoyl-CoA reductase [Pelagibaculum spongiae]
MIIQPIIKGAVAKTAHPYGCQQAVLEQIQQAQSSHWQTSQFKKVLVLGASSGFGLASRIALTFGGALADSIGVSFERGPNQDKQLTGTAGWYNNIYFRQYAEEKRLIAKNFIGDAFSDDIRQQVIDYIKSDFGGSVDLVVYSLASGIRPDPETGTVFRSAIKTIDKPYSGYVLNLESDSLEQTLLPVASQQEIQDTVKVMGGEDWQDWLTLLADAGVLAKGCQTIAYSYMGPKITHPIYHQGTLGKAKDHLHQTAEQMNQQLNQSINGQAKIAVCKALVTKASIYIPGFSPYMMALFKIMKQAGNHESCIEHMMRLFGNKIAQPLSKNCLIRMDDWELDLAIQNKVAQLLPLINSNNFKEIADYSAIKKDFMQLNGFEFNSIDYEEDIDLSSLKNMHL